MKLASQDKLPNGKKVVSTNNNNNNNNHNNKQGFRHKAMGLKCPALGVLN